MPRLLFAALLLVLTACATGPDAPPVDGVEVACIEPLCISYPAGWAVVEQGAGFIAFAHPDAPEQALATVGPVNMQAVVENAGGSWPASTEQVVRSFWRLLEQADVATFERLQRDTGGAFRSQGSFEDGRLWHLLIPGTGNRAIGVEVRGPDASWQDHADVFFADVRIFE
ncbi:MAG: hypothetical protein BMS9Abin07_1693 [Acidimicrobiia bacterium]|nr:MAG: hypothetical protein BMS9Abin07_1693 [Acidimicrobiia bacterium]